MLTNQRLEEMRQAELLIVQRPFQHVGVKRRSEELAEALGELLERRIDCAQLIFVEKQKMLALTVEEEGVSPQILDDRNYTIFTPEQSGEVRALEAEQIWGGK
jgi:hypothetical protein